MPVRTEQSQFTIQRASSHTRTSVTRCPTPKALPAEYGACTCTVRTSSERTC